MLTLSTSISTLIATLVLATASHAQVTVDDPWVRGTVAEQKSTGAFMYLTAKTNSKLVQASSTAADHVEIHKMVMENDVMKMRQIPELALPANQRTALEPGGHHIMLIGLKKKISAGDEVPLTLTVEETDGTRQQIEVKAIARALQGGLPHHHH